MNACTVAVPQAAGIAVDLIEAEVFKWIIAFNNTHGVDEGIYEDGAFVMGEFYLFTATSHALAVYLCLRNGTRTMDRYTPPYPICESSDRDHGLRTLSTHPDVPISSVARPLCLHSTTLHHLPSHPDQAGRH